MVTPFDWQEGIGFRAQYVEGRLEQGLPIVAASVDAGILVLTYRRNARKVFEVYDRLLYSAIGRQADVEALRVAAVDFASQEGYRRSEHDVTVERVVAALSAPVQKAFSDFSTSPIVARCLFAEVGNTPADDRFFVLDYDGDYRSVTGSCVIAGDDERRKAIESALNTDALAGQSPEQAASELLRAWQSRPSDAQPENTAELTLEVALLDRTGRRDNRFQLIDWNG